MTRSYKKYFFLGILYSLFQLSVQRHVPLEIENITDYLAVDACRDKRRLIDSDKHEEFELVEAELTCKLTLQCHFCDDTDDYIPKLWYRQSRYRDNNLTEVKLGTNNILASNRVFMKPDHSLVINNIKREDSALYYCGGSLGEDMEYKFNFLVDVINATTKTTIGTIAQWKEFQHNKFIEINKKFAISSRNDYAKIRNKGILLTAKGKWRPWGKCDGCRKIRMRIFDCRLMPRLLKDSERFLNHFLQQSTGSGFSTATTLSYNATDYLQNLTTSNIYATISFTTEEKLLHLLNTTEQPLDTITLNIDKNPYIQDNETSDEAAFLLKTFSMSCHSLDFESLFPNISNELKEIGNFAVTEPCFGPCRIKASSTMPRYRNTLVLMEGDHFTLICPESTVDNAVVWKKDGSSLSSENKGGNIIIDPFYNLFIIYATVDEAANYTCFVDNVKMLEVVVLVYERSVLTSKAFIRHIQYLGFIFLFSVIFYSAGVILSWNRRHSFKKVDFIELKKRKQERYAIPYPEI